MSLEKLKLNKQLIGAMTEAGFGTPKQVQEKVMSRIIGGQDLIAIAPEGSGKTTAYVLALLYRLKYAQEIAPRALILVPTPEKIDEVVTQFELLNRSSLRILGFQPTGGIQSQVNTLVDDGCDIVVSTPERARSLYLKLGLNVNKIQTMVIDDADLMLKKGMQLAISELAVSIVKCQHLVFTDVLHDKLNKLLEPFMNVPAIVEVDDVQIQESNSIIPTIIQWLYQVPNYKTKLNLLNFLMRDDEFFTKTVVFVNSKFNAHKLYKSLSKRLNNEVALLKPMFFDLKGFKTIEEFKDSDIRILVVANEELGEINLDQVPFILHFDLPEENETFIKRITQTETSAEEAMAITFATDTELSQVKRIEHFTGQKMEVIDLPVGLIIENNQNKEKAAKKKAEEKELEGLRGKAFHEKKAQNAKDYNYSSKEKAKMKYKKR